ncbi:hypothetical protein LINPERHAP1_LOCUS25295 [Linum perenne]
MQDPYIMCWDERKAVEVVYKYVVQSFSDYLVAPMLDTINGFAFHPSLPMAVSSSGHRRFQVPDDEDDNFPLTDDENYVSVWSFSCGSTIETGDIDETLAA